MQAKNDKTAQTASTVLASIDIQTEAAILPKKVEYEEEKKQAANTGAASAMPVTTAASSGRNTSMIAASLQMETI